MSSRLFWVVDVIERIGFHVLRRSTEQRMALARELAFEWPAPMFERLVQAAVDVANAKVVHVQDVKDITSDSGFWYCIGWLQFLYSANSLMCGLLRLDEQSARGPKVEYERFTLEGINKCEPLSEFKRWQRHPAAKVPDMLSIDKFRLTRGFCSFLTHTNLVPVSFRRICLLCDIWESMKQEAVRGPTGLDRIQPLHLEVPRDPQLLLELVLAMVAEGEQSTQLRRPLRVVFTGEEARGPGVTKEFFKVAFRSFLHYGEGDEMGDVAVGHEAALFVCSEQRTYWFNEESTHMDAFRACGVLLGQAVLNNVLVPNLFPRVLYEILLQDLQSPCARAELGIEDIGEVSPVIAKTLRDVLAYVGEDIGETFGDLGWHRTGLVAEGEVLSQDNKVQLVRAYVHWFFRRRTAMQLAALSDGFASVLGGSRLLRSIVDAVQLEKIVCGGAIPVDAQAIRQGAAHDGWTKEEEAEYLPIFWQVLDELTEAEKVQFVVFVSASDRVPLRGWRDLGLIVYKDGVGDERLPRAHTCFNQLLLPKYSDKEKLRTSLLLAIANSEGFGLV